MCARDIALRQIIQAQREAFGETPVVDEDDRRTMRFDELEDLGVDRGPDRTCLAGLPHVLERNYDLDVELLCAARIDQFDGPPARDEAPDLLHRPLRRREADALHRLLGQAVEPLDGQRQMCAALRPRDGVYLVEDQRLDRLQHLPGLRREQEVERLRGRDQDVRVLAEHRRAVALRRVAGADGDVQLRAEPGERAAEVALDVVVERLQRRDVEQPETFARGVGQPVDPVQERGERLPRARRRLDQRVRAAAQSPASPAPGPESARRTSSRTTPASPS